MDCIDWTVLIGLDRLDWIDWNGLIEWPMVKMVYAGTLAMCMAMAAADRIEWVPQSSRVKPRRSVPMSATALRMGVSMSLPVEWIGWSGLNGVD
jgi:hypothetical protein